jgi:hypothetical protein
MSRDGSMSPEAAEATRRFVAVSDERVGRMQIDLSSLYTNEFVTGN